MALPKVPRRKNDSNKLFLVSLTETEYGTNGYRRVIETPQYDLGLFHNFIDAEKHCIRLNSILWKEKEIAFRLEQKREFEHFMELAEDEDQDGLETKPLEFIDMSYNERAQEKDREENFYHPVTLTIHPKE